MAKDLNLGYYPISTNYGYYIDKAPQNVLNELKIQVDNLQHNFDKGYKYNNELAGEIEHEYKIPPSQNTKSYLKDLTQKIENESNYIKYNFNPIPSLNMEFLWVNFQKKYEYNPVHNHYGTYGFVIWYQVPYTFKEENSYSYKSGSSLHGTFNFIYPTPFDKNNSITSKPLYIDNSKEGYIAIFPSDLNHIVYPFYSSDKYRITIAGNITY